MVYSKPHDTHFFGTPNHGFGVFEDNSPVSNGALIHHGPGWYGNVVFFDHDIVMVGPKKTFEECKKECIEVYEKYLKDFGSDYNL